MSESTGIRLTRSTITDLRLIGSEIAVRSGKLLSNDDERVNALIDHYRKTAQSVLEPTPAEGTS